MKYVISLAALLLAVQAHAGSSATSLACSSVDGKYIVSGFLPGQGEEEISVNVSYQSSLLYFTNSNEGGAKATVKLDAKKHSVKIAIQAPYGRSMLLESSDAKLVTSAGGTKGTFVGNLSGTNPYDYKPMVAPVKVRCYTSDEI